MPRRADEAIDAYARAARLDPSDKNALFRLGVAYRMRHESRGRKPGDFQAAVDAWGRALELDPNQYIWRRRIEQYGPRLAKPYAFYDWVAQAKAEIARRGETPVPLAVEPYGSELAGPVRESCRPPAAAVEPDPKGRIHRDEERSHRGRGGRRAGTVQAGPGGAGPRHLPARARPRGSHWNNESTPLRVWVAGAEGWTIEPPAAGSRTGSGRRIG